MDCKSSDYMLHHKVSEQSPMRSNYLTFYNTRRSNSGQRMIRSPVTLETYRVEEKGLTRKRQGSHVQKLAPRISESDLCLDDIRKQKCRGMLTSALLDSSYEGRDLGYSRDPVGHGKSVLSSRGITSLVDANKILETKKYASLKKIQATENTSSDFWTKHKSVYPLSCADCTNTEVQKDGTHFVEERIGESSETDSRKPRKRFFIAHDNHNIVNPVGKRDPAETAGCNKRRSYIDKARNLFGNVVTGKKHAAFPDNCSGHFELISKTTDSSHKGQIEQDHEVYASYIGDHCRKNRRGRCSNKQSDSMLQHRQDFDGTFRCCTLDTDTKCGKTPVRELMLYDDEDVWGVSIAPRWGRRNGQNEKCGNSRFSHLTDQQESDLRSNLIGDNKTLRERGNEEEMLFTAARSGRHRRCDSENDSDEFQNCSRFRYDKNKSPTKRRTRRKRHRSATKGSPCYIHKTHGTGHLGCGCKVKNKHMRRPSDEKLKMALDRSENNPSEIDTRPSAFFNKQRKLTIAESPIRLIGEDIALKTPWTCTRWAGDIFKDNENKPIVSQWAYEVYSDTCLKAPLEDLLTESSNNIYTDTNEDLCNRKTTNSLGLLDEVSSNSYDYHKRILCTNNLSDPVAKTPQRLIDWHTGFSAIHKVRMAPHLLVNKNALNVDHNDHVINNIIQEKWTRGLDSGKREKNCEENDSEVIKNDMFQHNYGASFVHTTDKTLETINFSQETDITSHSAKETQASYKNAIDQFVPTTETKQTPQNWTTREGECHLRTGNQQNEYKETRDEQSGMPSNEPPTSVDEKLIKTVHSIKEDIQSVFERLNSLEMHQDRTILKTALSLREDVLNVLDETKAVAKGSTAAKVNNAAEVVKIALQKLAALKNVLAIESTEEDDYHNQSYELYKTNKEEYSARLAAHGYDGHINVVPITTIKQTSAKINVKDVKRGEKVNLAEVEDGEKIDLADDNTLQPINPADYNTVQPIKLADYNTGERIAEIVRRACTTADWMPYSATSPQHSQKRNKEEISHELNRNRELDKKYKLRHRSSSPDLIIKEDDQSQSKAANSTMQHVISTIKKHNSSPDFHVKDTLNKKLQQNQKKILEFASVEGESNVISASKVVDTDKEIHVIPIFRKHNKQGSEYRQNPTQLAATCKNKVQHSEESKIILQRDSEIYNTNKVDNRMPTVNVGLTADIASQTRWTKNTMLQASTTSSTSGITLQAYGVRDMSLQPSTRTKGRLPETTLHNSFRSSTASQAIREQMRSMKNHPTLLENMKHDFDTNGDEDTSEGSRQCLFIKKSLADRRQSSPCHPNDTKSNTTLSDIETSITDTSGLHKKGNEIIIILDSPEFNYSNYASKMLKHFDYPKTRYTGADNDNSDRPDVNKVKSEETDEVEDSNDKVHIYSMRPSTHSGSDTLSDVDNEGITPISKQYHKKGNTGKDPSDTSEARVSKKGKLKTRKVYDTKRTTQSPTQKFLSKENVKKVLYPKRKPASESIEKRPIIGKRSIDEKQSTVQTDVQPANADDITDASGDVIASETPAFLLAEISEIGEGAHDNQPGSKSVNETQEKQKESVKDDKMSDDKDFLSGVSVQQLHLSIMQLYEEINKLRIQLEASTEQVKPPPSPAGSQHKSKLQTSGGKNLSPQTKRPKSVTPSLISSSSGSVLTSTNSLSNTYYQTGTPALHKETRDNVVHTDSTVSNHRCCDQSCCSYRKYEMQDQIRSPDYFQDKKIPQTTSLENRPRSISPSKRNQEYFDKTLYSVGQGRECDSSDMEEQAVTNKGEGAASEGGGRQESGVRESEGDKYWSGPKTVTRDLFENMVSQHKKAGSVDQFDTVEFTARAFKPERLGGHNVTLCTVCDNRSVLSESDIYTMLPSATFGFNLKHIASQMNQTPLTKIQVVKLSNSCSTDNTEGTHIQGSFSNSMDHSEPNLRQQIFMHEEDVSLSKKDFTTRSVTMEVERPQQRSCLDAANLNNKDGSSEEVSSCTKLPNKTLSDNFGEHESKLKCQLSESDACFVVDSKLNSSRTETLQCASPTDSLNEMCSMHLSEDEIQKQNSPGERSVSENAPFNLNETPFWSDTAESPVKKAEDHMSQRPVPRIVQCVKDMLFGTTKAQVQMVSQKCQIAHNRPSTPMPCSRQEYQNNQDIKKSDISARDGDEVVIGGYVHTCRRVPSKTKLKDDESKIDISPVLQNYNYKTQEKHGVSKYHTSSKEAAKIPKNTPVLKVEEINEKSPCYGEDLWTRYEITSLKLQEKDILLTSNNLQRQSPLQRDTGHYAAAPRNIEETDKTIGHYCDAINGNVNKRLTVQKASLVNISTVSNRLENRSGNIFTHSQGMKKGYIAKIGDAVSSTSNGLQQRHDNPATDCFPELDTETIHSPDRSFSPYEDIVIASFESSMQERRPYYVEHCGFRHKKVHTPLRGDCDANDVNNVGDEDETHEYDGRKNDVPRDTVTNDNNSSETNINVYGRARQLKHTDELVRNNDMCSSRNGRINSIKEKVEPTAAKRLSRTRGDPEKDMYCRHRSSEEDMLSKGYADVTNNEKEISLQENSEDVEDAYYEGQQAKKIEEEVDNEDVESFTDDESTEQEVTSVMDEDELEDWYKTTDDESSI